MGAIHPISHPDIVRIGDQERQSEIVQDALGCPLPVSFALPDLDQLTDEGEIVF